MRRSLIPLALAVALTMALSGSVLVQGQEARDAGEEDASAGDPLTSQTRPAPCLQEESLGPVRVQVGAVQALVEVGAPLAIPVRAKGVCGLAGFSFWLQFDRTVADLADVQETPFLAGNPAVDLEFVGLRPGAARQTISGLRPAGSGGVDGIGTLARLIFVGRRPGRTEVRLVRLQLLDPDGEVIPAEGVSLRLNVLPAGSLPEGARPAIPYPGP